MRIDQILAQGKPAVSFEFFPPKNEAGFKQLYQTIEDLRPLRPSYVSVTYGAGGSTRERTHATVMRILKETALKPAAHLTCVDATCEEVDEVAHAYWEGGVRNIVALRTLKRRKPHVREVPIAPSGRRRARPCSTSAIPRRWRGNFPGWRSSAAASPRGIRGSASGADQPKNGSSIWAAPRREGAGVPAQINRARPIKARAPRRKPSQGSQAR